MQIGIGKSRGYIAYSRVEPFNVWGKTGCYFSQGQDRLGAVPNSEVSVEPHAFTVSRDALLIKARSDPNASNLRPWALLVDFG